MAESVVPKTRRDIVVTFSDGSGTPKTYVVIREPGDLVINVPKQARNNFLDRNRLTGAVRFGEDQPITGSLSAYFSDATESGVAALMDVCNWASGSGAGYVSTNFVSTLGSSAEVKTLDVIVGIEGSDHGDGADHSITIDDCSLDYTWTDGDPITVGINYQSHTMVVPTCA